MNVGTLIVGAAIALGAEPAAPRGDTDFTAWVTSKEANVRAGPSRAHEVIATVEAGAAVQVARCEPACDARDGWAVLRPQGALHLSTLTLAAPHAGLEDVPFRYGKVRSEATVRSAPDDAAASMGTRKAGDVLAFRGDRPSGQWLESVNGGFVRAGEVQLFTPSDFRGDRSGELPLAFVRRHALRGAAARVRKVVQVTARSVVTAERALPRSSVRLAFRRERPASIPEGARWIHVDLSEQTLVAYEGDAPVLTTLVSTGKKDWQTSEGVHRVWLKVLHARMRGTREPYDVEEVPSVQFFHRGEALHGAFWHAHFGEPISHGCINLSLADAAWLFDWAPPKLPKGWHALRPQAAGAESLWVFVEKRSPCVRRPSPACFARSLAAR